MRAMQKARNTQMGFVVHDIVVGLTVSAVSLSLGGAFGLLSGRGVLVGMLSAAIYPLITSLCGGTKIQCSGPTGPMTTVFIAITASASVSLSGMDEALVPAFLNMTIFLTAIVLLIAGILRLGSWVTIVPNVVISGFMDGIAFIIWISQLKNLLQIGSPIIEGSRSVNCLVAVATLIIALVISRMTRSLSSRIAALLSGTLIALIVMTIICSVLALPVGRASADLSLHSWAEFSAFAASHSPTAWPWHLVLLALPWALQLAGIAYLDTLLTSLIIDRQRNDTSQRNKELGAQGFATAIVAFVGGIPGAQATERSVLMIKEGARSRLAGICVGIFGLIGVLILQDVVSLIPKAVFAGILLKVGYDVFDWHPLVLYARRWKKKPSRQSQNILHEEIFIVLLTAIMTVLLNIMAAVIVCTILFILLQKYKGEALHDLQIQKETDGFIDEP